MYCLQAWTKQYFGQDLLVEDLDLNVTLTFKVKLLNFDKITPN